MPGETSAICVVCSAEFVYRRTTKPRNKCDEHWSGARRVRTGIDWNKHIDEARRLYEGGASLNQIAKHFGAYHGALAKALKRAGVSLRPRYQTGPRNIGSLLPNRRSPQSKTALSMGATADQAERIHHREVNISGLTMEMKKANDEARRQWLLLLIEEQRDGIEKIFAEGRGADIDSAGT